MYPHRIHLAGPWEIRAGSKSVRVKYPFDLGTIAELQSVDPPITLRRTFRWPTELSSFKRLWLTINSTDKPIAIRLNDKLLGEPRAPYLPWTHDISSVVQPQNQLELSLPWQGSLVAKSLVLSPECFVSKTQHSALSAQHLSFLCGPIYLEVRRQVHLANVCCTINWQNDQPILEMTARAAGTSERPLAIVIRLNEEEVHYQECPELTRTTDRLQISIPLPPPKSEGIRETFWQPGQANVLHTLELHLLDPACLLDQHTYPVGFRQLRRREDDTYQINDRVIKEIRIHDLDEPLVEPVKLGHLDRDGVPIILRIPAEPTLQSAYQPLLWYHPCVVDYSFASNSIASRKP